MILKCFVNDSEMLFNNFEKLSNDFDMFFLMTFFNDLSSSSKNFGSEKTYKGGRGVLAPHPPCRFFSDPKLFRLVLKSRIFPFNPFWLAGANQKITFWGPWTYFEIIYIFDFDLNIFIFVSFIP